MIEQVYQNPDVYRIYVPLPNNPLKNLNSYLVKTPEKNLLIDTGFNCDECYEALKAGLDELEIDVNKTELFLTHLHSDHIGLCKRILPEGSKIYMSAADQDHLAMAIHEGGWDEKLQIYHKNGLSSEELEILRYTCPPVLYLPDGDFEAQRVEDGDKIMIGEYEFTVIFTPGHTPGHCCLYLEEQGLIFLGDHLLFSITPNITFWQGFEDSLEQYRRSLEKLGKLEIKTPFPAHRECYGKDVPQRIEELNAHHHYRLHECLQIVRREPDLCVYDIAGKMQWAIKARNWDEFPVNQKFFAMGETIAHLDFLQNRGYVEPIIDPNGYITYRAVDRRNNK